MTEDLYIKNARIVLSDRVTDEYSVWVCDGHIKLCASRDTAPAGARAIDANGSYLCAGFIDIHVHGGNGSDFMDATPADFANIAAYHASHGTTAMLATTTTSAEDELFAALDCFEQYQKAPQEGAALLGIHLEGPFFNAEQKGAQDDRYLKKPTADYIEKLFYKSAHIKKISAAPELDENWILADACRKRDIVLSCGHTSCTAAQAQEAFMQGYTCVTHLYSGMNGVIRKNCYRIAGLVEAAYLLDDMYVEVIADGRHLPKELLQLICKVKGADRIALVTDCSAASGITKTGAKIGSRKNGLDVVVRDGVAFLPDFTSFAGSVVTCDKMLYNMLHLTGMSLPDCVKTLTETPARILGYSRTKGRIADGYDADMVLWDITSDFVDIKSVIVNGREIIKAV